MNIYSSIALAMYRAYCKQAGGNTFDGKPLPSYAELGADRQACWLAVAREACWLAAAREPVAQVAAMRDAAPDVQSRDDWVPTSREPVFTMPYQFQPTAQAAPVAPLEQSPVVFSSGYGGDFAGGGASGNFGSSGSSDSNASDSGSSSSSD